MRLYKFYNITRINSIRSWEEHKNPSKAVDAP